MPADVVQQPHPSQGTPQAPDPSQYQVPDPTASQPAPQGAPLTSAQNPSGTQDPSVQTQQSQVAAQAGQQQTPQSAPASDMHTPSKAHPAVSRILQSARAITDQLVPTPYKTTIDPNTGETTRTPQPLSARALSLSLIMEALQGGLSGAGARGPNATGQAAEAGLQQGERIAAQRQQAQADSDQQAQTDIKTRQQVVINGMQTRQLAMTLGRQSMEDAQAQVAVDAPDWQAHQEDPQSILGQGLTKEDAYAQLAKLGYGNAQVLLTGVKPRVDPKTGEPLYQLNGKIVPKDTPGAYTAPDFQYALVKPDAKISPVNDDGTLKAPYQRAVAQGYASIATGADGKLPAGFKMDAKSSQAALRGSQTAQAVQSDVNRVRAAEGLQPLADSAFDADLASGSDVRNGLNIYNNQLGLGATHAQAMQAVLGSKYSSAAGTINNWYGGKAKTDSYDKHAATLQFDADVLNGDKPLVTRDDAQLALASKNKQVVAAGQEKMKQLDAVAARTASTEAFAKEGAHVWGEEQIAKSKAALAGTAAGADNPYFSEPLNQNGIREAYVQSLPDGDLVKNIIQGTVPPPPPRTKESKALLAEVAHATGGRYDASKYDTYQKLRKDMLPSGKVGASLTAASTALDHLDEMVSHASMVSAAPVTAALSGKGLFGSKSQVNTKTYQEARDVAASELGKAVEGKVLTQGEADDWKNRLHAWTPGEAKANAKPLAELLHQRIKEAQDRIKQEAPAGIVTGLNVISQRGLDSYNHITGSNEQMADYLANNNSSQSTQQANPIAQPAAAAPTVYVNPQTKERVVYDATQKKYVPYTGK